MVLAPIPKYSMNPLLPNIEDGTTYRFLRMYFLVVHLLSVFVKENSLHVKDEILWLIWIDKF